MNSKILRKLTLMLGKTWKIFLIIFLTSASLVVRAQSAPIDVQSAAQLRNDNYRIGPGDVIDIAVAKNEILSRTGVRVSNQGMVQLPMIEGEVQASCRTERELAEAIKDKYRKYLLNPQVIVSVKEYNSKPVTIIGAVNTPARFQLQRPTHLLEVLTLGNGPNTNAGKNIQIIRNPVMGDCGQSDASGSDEEQLLTYQLSETLQGSEAANPLVKPGDIVRITEAEKVEIGQAYVIGSVKSAKTVDLNGPVTLTQAIAMAGGTAEGAQLDKVKISRKIPNSLNKTEIIANLKEINKKNEGDILLQSNDIVEVPGPNGTKKFLSDLYKNIIPSVTRIPLVY